MTDEVSGPSVTLLLHHTTWKKVVRRQLRPTDLRSPTQARRLQIVLGNTYLELAPGPSTAVSDAMGITANSALLWLPRRSPELE